MSWFSRAGSSWGAGRFSPFGRANTGGDGEVKDSDYGYITNDDLRKHRGSSNAGGAGPEIVDWDDKNPDRETDVLIFKQGRTNYPTHFPAMSIRDGELKVGTVRQTAAKKLGVSDSRRIRMFYKGRNLKNDDRLAREEGLRGDGTGSEILCVVGEAGSGAMAPGAEDVGMPGDKGRSWSEGEDEEDESGGEDSGINDASAGRKKKPRKRGGKKNKKKGGSGTNTGSSTPSHAYSNANSAGAEFLPIPAHIGGPARPTSAPPQNIPRAATPQTPIGKLDAIASKFHTELVPLCIPFMQNPPAEKKDRDFEYKKLSETILTQVLMKLDGVETEGDPDARARRKALVKEVQGMLSKLDEVVK